MFIANSLLHLSGQSCRPRFQVDTTTVDPLEYVSEITDYPEEVCTRSRPPQRYSVGLSDDDCGPVRVRQ